MTTDNLFSYTLDKIPEAKEDIDPKLFVALKTLSIAKCYADAHSKLTAYNYLIEHNFNAPKEHEIWLTIDEPYEYYQQIAKNIQQSAGLEDQK